MIFSIGFGSASAAAAAGITPSAVIVAKPAERPNKSRRARRVTMSFMPFFPGGRAQAFDFSLDKGERPMPDKPWRSAPVAGALCSIYLCEMQQSPKLADLRAFAALAETSSFREAGKRLGRDPTVLSRSVRSLERQLGVRLAEWTTRAVTLTEAGSVYASRVSGLLQEFEAASREAAAFGQGEPQGHLRVTLPGSFARLWMAPLVTGFLQAHPRVTLEAHYSNAFVDIVTQGFDLAVRLAELPDSRLIARKIASRRRLVCASPAYLATRGVPTAPDDLVEHDCLCFTGRNGPYSWTFQNQAGTRQSVVVRRRAASDDADILVEAAAAGLGLFYTTDWHVSPLLADGRLVEVMADWPVADGGGIFILTNSAVCIPSKTRAFSNWIAKGLAKPP